MAHYSYLRRARKLARRQAPRSYSRRLKTPCDAGGVPVDLAGNVFYRGGVYYQSGTNMSLIHAAAITGHRQTQEE